MSLSTESLGHQARTLVCAYLKPAHAAGVLKFCRLFRQSFANFLVSYAALRRSWPTENAAASQ